MRKDFCNLVAALPKSCCLIGRTISLLTSTSGCLEREDRLCDEQILPMNSLQERQPDRPVCETKARKQAGIEAYAVNCSVGNSWQVRLISERTFWP